ncbi:glucosidase family protein [Puniceicoccus vermicola]|uniref:Uncharacterized protein n=1 Tax=Puniceicoccus vermicola TaxID=388746 RepID=A0A7X1AZ23_9BACT|nr:hypothetical protein [Puniceicoccus vermicola]MBC2602611.1 hypothetical protein [Puniceicoccus vermicola]
MTLEYSSLIPTSPHGFGLGTTHYISGRISACVAAQGGLYGIRYYGQQPHAKSLFFEAAIESGFNKLFRLQVIIDGRIYFPEFNQTQHMPFGFQSQCTLEGVTLRHSLILDQNLLAQRIQVLENPENREIRARLIVHGHLRTKVNGRINQAWEVLGAEGLYTRTIDEVDESEGNSVETRIKLGSTQPLAIQTRKGTFKYYVETTRPSESATFYLAFNHTPESAGMDAQIDRKIKNYEEGLRNGLRFESGNPCLDSALTNAVPTVCSLELADTPGAVRASQSYWVWGWDSMVHAEAWLWSGQTRLVRDMLSFCEDTAHPEKGVAHALHSDFSLQHSMAPSAQCLYVVMLYNYFAATGDQETLDKHLPFARTILEKAGAARSQHNSLSTGKGFFPDHPEELEQKEDDISLINNSLYFQALSAVNEICGGYEDELRQLQADMETVLWDTEQGYWVDSVDEKDLTQRKYYPAYGQLYVSPFGTQPKAESNGAIGAFLREHSLFEHGIYMFPRSMPGFMADGNQLGAYYPSVDRYYWNIMNRCGHIGSADDFERIVTHFWNEHSYPEGLTHETENVDPALDNPGCKQAFAARSWCCDALELHFGLRVDLNGFHLNPLPSGNAFKVSGLMLRGRKISIERQASNEAMRIFLNDTEVDSPIRWEQLENRNYIRIE